MRPDTEQALVDALSDVDEVVEVGVGNRPDVAAGLAARGVSVTATDITNRETPPEVTFVQDDVTDPRIDLYRDADVVYALNCPPELHRPLCELAQRVDADCRFTTLGTDPPVLDVQPRQLPGETLYAVETGRD